MAPYNKEIYSGTQGGAAKFSASVLTLTCHTEEQSQYLPHARVVKNSKTIFG